MECYYIAFVESAGSRYFIQMDEIPLEPNDATVLAIRVARIRADSVHVKFDINNIRVALKAIEDTDDTIKIH